MSRDVSRIGVETRDRTVGLSDCRTVGRRTVGTVRTVGCTVGLYKHPHRGDINRTALGHSPDSGRTLARQRPDSSRTAAGQRSDSDRTATGRCPDSVRTVIGHERTWARTPGHGPDMWAWTSPDLTGHRRTAGHAGHPGLRVYRGPPRRTEGHRDVT